MSVKIKTFSNHIGYDDDHIVNNWISNSKDIRVIDIKISSNDIQNRITILVMYEFV